MKITQNRELSWLQFNKRVIEEAADPRVPLLERAKFLSIFTSNLDEFYMIRCGSLYDLSLIDDTKIDKKAEWFQVNSLMRFLTKLANYINLEIMYIKTSTIH